MELRGHHGKGLELPQCGADGCVSAARAEDIPRLTASRLDQRALGADCATAGTQLLLAPLRRALTATVSSPEGAYHLTHAV